MRLAGNAQPGLGVGLVRADLRAQFLVENFRAAAGHHDQTDGLEALEHFQAADALQPGEMLDFHGSEGLERQIGVDLPHRAQHVLKPAQAQFGMTAAHDVQLVQVQGALPGRAQPLQDILFAQAERAGLAVLVAAEGAERAAVDADVGIVDLPVDHVKGRVAVQAAAYVQGEGPHGGDVRTAEQGQAVVETQTLAGQHFFMDGRKAQCGVVCGVKHVQVLYAGVAAKTAVGKTKPARRALSM